MGEAAERDLLTVRDWLDEALVGVRDIENRALDLVEVRSFLSLALAAVYEGCRENVDHPTVTSARTRAAEFARQALEGLQAVPVDEAAVDRELSLVARSVGALQDPTLGPPIPGLVIPHGRARPPLMASTVEPTLHDPARGPLFPTIPLRDRDDVVMPDVDPDAAPLVPVPEIRTLEELLAYAESVESKREGGGEPAAALPEPTPPPADPLAEAQRALLGDAIPERLLVFERARVCFEDLAMLSLVRQGGAADIWYQLEPLERRLLARVDAILALGVDLVPRLVQLLEDRPIPDAELLWASIFLLGCIRGDDTRDQIVRLVRLAPLDDEEYFEPIAEALALVPHRGVEGVARKWLESPEPQRVALAARVLGWRRATTVESILPLLGHDEPRVIEEAARALERVPGELREDDLRIALRHESPAVFAAAVETAIVRGFPGAVSECEFRLQRQQDLPHAALMLALTSNREALDLCFGLAATHPSAEVLETLGWLGQTSIVPFLLGRLRAGEVAAVRPLQRLTGASLTDEMPARAYAEEDLPFARSHFLAPPHELVLTEDPDAWEAHWRQYGEPAREDRRYRFGHPWSTRDDQWEMAEAYAANRERRLAYLELCGRTGGSIGFDQYTWTARQRPQLEAWSAYLGPAHGRVPSGTWPSRLAR